jgi:hypothetical protein
MLSRIFVGHVLPGRCHSACRTILRFEPCWRTPVATGQRPDVVTERRLRLHPIQQLSDCGTEKTQD